MRSRVLTTTIAFLAVALLAVGGAGHCLCLVDLDELVRQDVLQEAGQPQRLAQHRRHQAIGVRPEATSPGSSRTGAGC
ncbi:hypothetical protein [Kocuria aegyptia]|uniref:Secreted protein n=1 Tax=Kocuria aegyptia TaxID=330943 RepID=A0ABP4XE72_9MICC